jgi:hypothetical protein
VTSGINTRQKLRERDPRLAQLMTLAYGDGDWRYPHTAPRKFEPYEETSEEKRSRQTVPVLSVQADGDMTNPLLAAGGSAAGAATRRNRRRADSPVRRVRRGTGSKLIAAPQRLFTRLFGCCLP